MTISYSVDEIMSFGPCITYPRDRVEALWSGRERMTLLEILDLPIPADNRVWVICLAPPIGWLDRVVDRAVRTHALGCGIPAVETWAARWLSGENRSHIAAAAMRSRSAAATWTEATWIAAAWAVAAAEAAGWCSSRALGGSRRSACEAAARSAAQAWGSQVEYARQVEDARELLAQEAPCDC